MNDNPNPLSLMKKYMLWLIAASFTLTSYATTPDWNKMADGMVQALI